MISFHIKRFYSLILLACTLLTLPSCSFKRTDAPGILSELITQCESVPAHFLYSSDTSEKSLDEENSYLLFRDKNLPSYCESYAIALGENDALWEIHVFVARSLGDAGFIENALYKRLHLLQNRDIYIYDTQAYEEHVSSGKVVRNGKIVCLALCDNNLKIAKEIKRL